MSKIHMTGTQGLYSNIFHKPVGKVFDEYLLERKSIVYPIGITYRELQEKDDFILDTTPDLRRVKIISPSPFPIDTYIPILDEYKCVVLSEEILKTPVKMRYERIFFIHPSIEIFFKRPMAAYRFDLDQPLSFTHADSKYLCLGFVYNNFEANPIL